MNHLGYQIGEADLSYLDDEKGPNFGYLIYDATGRIVGRSWSYEGAIREIHYLINDPPAPRFDECAKQLDREIERLDHILAKLMAQIKEAANEYRV